MSKDSDPAGSGGWSGRVGFTGGINGTAYRLFEVIVFGDQGVEQAKQLFGVKNIVAVTSTGPRPRGPYAQPQGFSLIQFDMDAGIDPVYAVRQLRLAGVQADLNHVLFAHGDWCCGPHPALLWQYGFAGSPLYGSPLYGSPLYGSPLYGSPLYGSPLYGSAVYGSPLYGSPLYGSPVYGSPEALTPPYGSPIYASPGSQYQATGMHHSSAVPADAPTPVLPVVPPGAEPPTVMILDTGLAFDIQCPQSLVSVAHSQDPSEWQDAPSSEPDGYLDPCVGHGTFIAGLIDSVAPGCDISIQKVLSSFGDGDEFAIAAAINGLDPAPDLLSLSFGGYGLHELGALAISIAAIQLEGTVVVASAGNDSICRPCYPAAFDGVIGVAALGPAGPAGFSNYGNWVQACAPGVDIVSTFFMDAPGPEPPPSGYPEPDVYRGWARWSGTSFSAPLVVGALAREMQIYGIQPADAVASVVNAPALLRIPLFGTVVNLP
jgi:hypothetical protein